MSRRADSRRNVQLCFLRAVGDPRIVSCVWYRAYGAGVQRESACYQNDKKRWSNLDRRTARQSRYDVIPGGDGWSRRALKTLVISVNACQPTAVSATCVSRQMTTGGQSSELRTTGLARCSTGLAGHSVLIHTRTCSDVYGD